MNDKELNLLESSIKAELTVAEGLDLVYRACEHHGYTKDAGLKSSQAKKAMEKAAGMLCRSLPSIIRYMRCYLLCESYPEIRKLVDEGKLSHSVLDLLVTVPGDVKIEAAKKVSGMFGRDALPILNRYKGL